MALRFKINDRVVVENARDSGLRHGIVIGWPSPRGDWRVKLDSAKRPVWVNDDFLRAETEQNAGARR